MLQYVSVECNRPKVIYFHFKLFVIVTWRWCRKTSKIS